MIITIYLIFFLILFSKEIYSQNKISVLERSIVSNSDVLDRNDRQFNCICYQLESKNEKICAKIRKKIITAKKLIGIVGTSDYIIYKAEICKGNSCNKVKVLSTGVFYYLNKKYVGGKRIISLFKKLTKKVKGERCKCKRLE